MQFCDEVPWGHSPAGQRIPTRDGEDGATSAAFPAGCTSVFLPTFPSAAMQCQRWLQAQALAQSLTLPQSPGSGEQHENTWPLSRAAAVCLPAPGEPEGLELQGA